MIDNSTQYAGAWCVESPAEVETLAKCGFNLFFVPCKNLGLTAVQAVLEAIVSPAVAVADLSDWGHDLNGAAAGGFLSQLASTPSWAKVKAVQLFDEPNIGTIIPLGTQQAWYRALRQLIGQLTGGPNDRYVVTDFHANACGLGPTPWQVDKLPGASYDVAFVNYYAVRWGYDDATAAKYLVAALAAARGWFDPKTPIGFMEQACGALVDPGVPPDACGDTSWTRPMPGLLASQHNDFWMKAFPGTSVAAWYGPAGTCPEEDWNGRKDPSVLTELAAVIAAHRGFEL